MRAQVRLALVLPRREAFVSGFAGAIGMQVRLAAEATGGVVFGVPHDKTFADVRFAPVPPLHRPALVGLSGDARYAAAVARALQRGPPGFVEVHNRAAVAVTLARLLPDRPVSLVLNNDPSVMRGFRSLHRLAGIVTTSAYLRDRLAPADRARAKIVPNAIGAVPRPGVSRAGVLYAGRIVPEKGVLEFVAAWDSVRAKLAGWTCTLIGAERFGPDTPVTPYVREVRARALAAGIAVEGYQPHAAVLHAMAQAAIVCVPSVWPEPFGMTALEAIATGAALVASETGGLPEVAGEAAIWVPSGNVPALAAAIAALVGDPQRRAALGAAGLARAKGFDIGVVGPLQARAREEITADWSRRTGRTIS